MLAFWPMLLLSALELDAPGVPCPEPAAVRLRLRALGVSLEARDARASWSLEGEQLALEVRTASAALARRTFLTADCAELTEQLALAIERATAPLGLPPPSPEPPAPSPPWGFEAGVGPLAVLAPDPAIGLLASGLVWPGNGAFGGSLVIGGSLPEAFTVRTTAVDVQRYFLAAGGAARWRPGRGLSLGSVVALSAELIRAVPAGVKAPVTVTDLRPGLRAGAFAGTAVGPLALRLQLDLRVWLARRTYRAIPATQLVSLGSAELEVSLVVGWAHPE